MTPLEIIILLLCVPIGIILMGGALIVILEVMSRMFGGRK